MTGTPPVSAEVQAVLEDHAKKHSRFETFQQEMNRLAEHVWHNVRSRGDQATAEQERVTEPADNSEEEEASQGPSDPAE